MHQKIEVLRFLIKSCERESLHALNQKLQPLGLTANQAEVLLILNQYGPLSVKALGELIICEKRSPSRLAKSLVDKELIAKSPDPEDTRISLLELTESGRALIPSVREASQGFDKDIAERLTNQDDLDTLISILTIYLRGTGSWDKMKRRFPDFF